MAAVAELRADDLRARAAAVARRIAADVARSPRLWGVPRGGVPAAYAVASAWRGGGARPAVVDSAEEADAIVDDVVDSGRTRALYRGLFPHKPFHALVDKTDPGDPLRGVWIHFPWESGVAREGADLVARMLSYIGEDPTRDGLRDTPERVVAAWRRWFAGYDADPESFLANPEDGAARAGETVAHAGLPVHSHCERHLAPFFGVAHVGYVVGRAVCGAGDLTRLVDAYARRVQRQQRLTDLVADAVWTGLAPAGAGVVLRCRHSCGEPRAVVETAAWRGAMARGEPRARFLGAVAAAE